MKKIDKENSVIRQKALDKCVEIDVYIDEVRHFAGTNNKQHTKSWIEKIIQDTKKSVMDLERLIGEIDEK